MCAPRTCLPPKKNRLALTALAMCSPRTCLPKKNRTPAIQKNRLALRARYVRYAHNVCPPIINRCPLSCPPTFLNPGAATVQTAMEYLLCWDYFGPSSRTDDLSLIRMFRHAGFCSEFIMMVRAWTILLCLYNACNCICRKLYHLMFPFHHHCFGHHSILSVSHARSDIPSLTTLMPHYPS